MSSPNSSSNRIEGGTSTAYELLDIRIQEWIYNAGWTELRDIQEEAILSILEEPGDLIISAATAAGKTEAAFLPILSSIIAEPASGVRALYIGPLKALINDQFGRLEELCKHIEIPVHRWHGDVAASAKQRLIRKPDGILLITPESLEALFIRHGSKLVTVFKNLSCVVADEVHAYIGSERGRQLQSLLHRLDTLLRRRVPRIGLSATIGDIGLAARFLRPGHPDGVKRIVSVEDGREIRLQVRGYREAAPEEQNGSAKEKGFGGDRAIAEHLYATLRGTNNLIFTNRRDDVEKFTDILRQMCDDQHVPVEFFPHHGNLSKEIREDAETLLKAANRPTNVVCTSTLELGIDIGAMSSIAQIGAPPSVSSLRQRLGRSGRRDDPAVMRVYDIEPEITKNTSLQDTLHEELVQIVAMLELLLRNWCESPTDTAFHFSTLIQQTLSLLAQYGAATAKELWSVLCRTGPFSNIDQTTYGLFLRGLAAKELLKQCSDDTLVLDLKGERIVNHFTFYAAFNTPEEYRVFASAKMLGTLPVAHPILEDEFIIYAGRRWRVLGIDEDRKAIDVAPAGGGRLPKFTGNASWIDSGIRREMYRVYCTDAIPTYLNPIARDLLAEGREHFRRYELHKRAIVRTGSESLLFFWTGDRELETIRLMLAARNVKAMLSGCALSVEGPAAELLSDHLYEIANSPPDDPIELASLVGNRELEKHDHFLPEELLNREYAARYLDCEGAQSIIADFVRSGPVNDSSGLSDEPY